MAESATTTKSNTRKLQCSGPKLWGDVASRIATLVQQEDEAHGIRAMLAFSSAHESDLAAWVTENFPTGVSSKGERYVDENAVKVAKLRADAKTPEQLKLINDSLKLVEEAKAKAREAEKAARKAMADAMAVVTANGGSPAPTAPIPAPTTPVKPAQGKKR